MKYHFKVHKEGRGYWAECVELDGCITQADTMTELTENMAEALNSYLDEPQDSRAFFPEARFMRGRNIVAVPVEPRIALASMMRRLRLAHELTQTMMARLLGFKGLYSYQRLESSKTANPEFETIVRIKRAFPEVNLDDLVAV